MYLQYWGRKERHSPFSKHLDRSSNIQEENPSEVWGDNVGNFIHILVRHFPTLSPSDGCVLRRGKKRKPEKSGKFNALESFFKHETILQDGLEGARSNH